MARAAGDWRKRLTWELRAAKRLFVLGVGNPDRADDGAGSRCVRLLQREMTKTQSITPPCHVDRPSGAKSSRRSSSRLFYRPVFPESMTGPIRIFRPTHVLVIDAASAGHPPGTVFFINKKKVSEDDLTTHRIPLSQLVRYLEESVGCRVILLGIEPGTIAAGRTVSPEVKAAVSALSSALTDTLVKLHSRRLGSIDD
jgi:hydrogenase 3 maturation protease